MGGSAGRARVGVYWEAMATRTKGSGAAKRTSGGAKKPAAPRMRASGAKKPAATEHEGTKATKKPARARSGAKRATRSEPSERARATAKRIATKVLHTHFPASTPFKDLGRFNGHLRSAKSRGAAPTTDFFRALLDGAVFTYAGPSCYWTEAAAGDTVLFFGCALVDDADLGIAASPFDSGALEDPNPRLQPMATWPLARREEFVREHTHEGPAWRAVFERWLLECYGETPERYLETHKGRHLDGKPDALPVPGMLEKNGLEDEHCADRRAWLWEVRFHEDLPFRRVERVLLPEEKLQKVLELFPNAEAETYPTENAPEARRELLYQRSGELQRYATGVHR